MELEKQYNLLLNEYNEDINDTTEVNDSNDNNFINLKKNLEEEINTEIALFKKDKIENKKKTISFDNDETLNNPTNPFIKSKTILKNNEIENIDFLDIYKITIPNI